MKTTLHAPSGIARTGAIITAILGFAAVTAFARTTVNLKIGGKGFEFGQGVELKASSGSQRLIPSQSFTYRIVGTCTGTGALARAFPAKTPISTFLNLLKPGNGALVAGTYPNPSGKLGFTVINQTFTGTRKINKFGDVTLSAKVVAGTRTNGEVYLEVTQVKVTSANKAPLGTIQFDRGAKFIVDIAPLIQFNAKGQAAFAENVGTVQILVTRFGNTKGATTINYTTVNDTAVSDLDFTPTAGTLSFADGDTEEFITVPIINRPEANGRRSFKIVLSSPQAGSVIGRNPENTVVIIDAP